MTQNYYQKFKELPWEIKNAIDNKEIKEEIKKLSKKYNMDFSTIVFSVATKDLLMDELLDYFKNKYKKDNNTAINIKNDLEKYIFEPILDYLYEDIIIGEDNFNLERDEQKIRSIFRKKLLNVIDFYSNKKLKQLNEKIIFLLWNLDSFQQNLLKDLSNNVEKLTSQNIIIDDKIKSPTIGNWLSDFIKERGTSKINSLIISEYLSHFDNAKKVLETEKEKIKQLLAIYGNLKFFPNNMANIPIKDWEIIPVKKEKKKAKEESAEINILEITDQEREDYKYEKAGKLENEFRGEIEKKVIEEEVLGKIDRSHIVARKRELNALVNQYKKGSLERKAIQDELDKISE
ncbi:MAG: hypothetical protein U9O55_02215 [Patescibacteria group bacterium]|nr:hypothetical protein [Patescibacteria group bacterium]